LAPLLSGAIFSWSRPAIALTKRRLGPTLISAFCAGCGTE
jgi:hypothetical protein